MSRELRSILVDPQSPEGKEALQRAKQLLQQFEYDQSQEDSPERDQEIDELVALSQEHDAVLGHLIDELPGMSEEILTVLSQVGPRAATAIPVSIRNLGDLEGCGVGFRSFILEAGASDPLNVCLLLGKELEERPYIWRVAGNILFHFAEHSPDVRELITKWEAGTIEPALFTTRFFKVLRAAGIAGWGLAS